jgi:hypothetical protein
MLGDSRERRGEVVAVLPPAGADATFELIAANAVMAGCRPEYFPVVIAAVQALADPELGLEDLLTTVHSAAPLVLVSGPLAQEIGMNGGASVLGSGNRANATIGRAVQLCCQNIAGARPGGLDAATIGHPGKYSYCFTEHPASPWPPLAEDRGFNYPLSTVTIYGADAPLCITEMARPNPEGILRTVAAAAAIPGTYNAYHRRELWLVLSPDHALIISSEGWAKSDVAQYIYDHARMRAAFLRERGSYGYYRTSPPWVSEAAPDDMIPIVDSPDRVIATVAGGPFGGYTAIIFGLGGVSVTKPIASLS